MQFDAHIVVLGGGAAGLCAAIAARRRGASVLVVERAPAALRGGNARHARNFRAAHAAPELYSPGVYSRDEFLAELTKIGGPDIDVPLARSLIGDSETIASWLAGCDVRLQAPQTGVIPYSRRTAFLLGGGKAMVNALYRAAAKAGVDIAYDSEVVGLDCAADGACCVATLCGGERRRLTARGLIAAAGGPVGALTDGVVVRGGAYSDGSVMQMLLGAGAAAVGDPTMRHMVAVDARGPKFDGGIVTRVTAIPYGLVVDGDGARVDIADRGAGRAHYARWGVRIARCRGGLAYLILDAEGLRRAQPLALAPIRADSLAGLAGALGLDAAAVTRSIETSNAHARPLAFPPFSAVPLRAGLTFVHYGIAVDARMRVLTRDGVAMDSLFAAGMIMAANVLRRGYLAGFGLTLAMVSGRRAGEAAASHVFG